jgi:crossover junction endodeoxyribonuclease RusA
MVEIELPFPPSVNHLWRRVGNRTIVSRGGRAFCRAVHAALIAQGVRPMIGRLVVTIDVCPPDNRRRDLDNVMKALLDALQHGGAYHDDGQIDELHIRRGVCVPGGRVHVRIEPHPDSETIEFEGVSTDVPSSSKPRNCLKCGTLFLSTSPGNRICPSCRHENDKLRLTEGELQKQRGGKRRRLDTLDGDAT